MQRSIPCVIIILILAFIGIWKSDWFLNNIWNYLVVNEEPRPSDVIIVLSGGEFQRVEYGVKLLQQGYADKILFSGGSAQVLRRRAISQGVTEEQMLLETKSGTTFENALYSANIMREQGFNSAIIVTSPYHTRRVSIIFNEIFKDWEITISPYPYDESISSNWWKDRATAEIVISEYLKLVWHYLFER